MMWVAAASVLTTLLAAILMFMFLQWMQNKTYMSLFKTRIVVTLKNGDLFSGVMMSRDRKVLRLVDVQDLTSVNPVSLGGELFVPLVEVNYMQRVEVLGDGVRRS